MFLVGEAHVIGNQHLEQHKAMLLAQSHMQEKSKKCFETTASLLYFSPVVLHYNQLFLCWQPLINLVVCEATPLTSALSLGMAGNCIHT